MHVAEWGFVHGWQGSLRAIITPEFSLLPMKMMTRREHCILPAIDEQHCRKDVRQMPEGLEGMKEGD